LAAAKGAKKLLRSHVGKSEISLAPETCSASWQILLQFFNKCASLYIWGTPFQITHTLLNIMFFPGRIFLDVLDLVQTKMNDV